MPSRVSVVYDDHSGTFYPTDHSGTFYPTAHSGTFCPSVHSGTFSPSAHSGTFPYDNNNNNTSVSESVLDFSRLRAFSSALLLQHPHASVSSLNRYLQSCYQPTSMADQERAVIYFNGLEAGQVDIADRVLRAVQSAGVNIPTDLLGPIWEMCVQMGDIRSRPLTGADVLVAPVPVMLNNDDISDSESVSRSIDLPGNNSPRYSDISD